MSALIKISHVKTHDCHGNVWREISRDTKVQNIHDS